MEIKEIRRHNLLILIDRNGGQEQLSKLTGHAPSMFSNIKTRTRRMGDRMARSMECALNLGPGWMDVYHPADALEDTMKDRLIYYYTMISPEARKKLLQAANAIYLEEFPEVAIINPRKIPRKKPHSRKSQQGNTTL